MNWHQLKTVLWLRWRLTRNQWARSGGIGAVLAAVVAVAALVLAAGGFVGGALAGIFALRSASPVVVMAVWLGLTAAFLFFWMLGLITDLQRSETIDLQTLMHLPVVLGQLFIVNYIASHLSVSIVLFVPAMLGVALGLSISRGPSMLLLIPLALSMIFMVTAWTYCLRGWLAALMSNPRRRRAVIMAVTTSFILLAQAPNLYFNVIRRSDRPARAAKETPEQRAAREAAADVMLEQWFRAQAAVPPLWVPVGARALAEGRAWPALLGTLGAAAIGALGLRRAYRSTLRFYRGERGGLASARTTSAASPPRARPAGRSRLVERRIPGVPDSAAAVALATFQSMLRAPEVKMQWGTSFVVTVILAASVLSRAHASLPAMAGPFVATGVVVFSMLLSVGFVGNQFGFDRDGFRALVLSPTERWQILLGKNLAALPVAAASATLLLTVVTVWLGLSPFVLLAALLQLVVGLLAVAMAGNLISILVPYRIRAGSMKPTKLPALAMVTLMGSQMALPFVMTPAFVPPLVGFLWERAGGPPAALANVALSLVLAGVMAFAYMRSLGPLGSLLHRREMRILDTVSVNVE